MFSSITHWAYLTDCAIKLESITNIEKHFIVSSIQVQTLKHPANDKCTLRRISELLGNLEKNKIVFTNFAFNPKYDY